MSDRLSEIEERLAAVGRTAVGTKEFVVHAPTDLAALVKFAREVRNELDQPHPTTAVIAQALDALEAS